VNIGRPGQYLLVVGSVTGGRWVCLVLPVSAMVRRSPPTVTWFAREWASWPLSRHSSISHSESTFCWIIKEVTFCYVFASRLI